MNHPAGEVRTSSRPFVTIPLEAETPSERGTEGGAKEEKDIQMEEAG